MASVHDSHSSAKNPTGVDSVSNEPAAEPAPSVGPQIALRSDGAFLLSVEDIPAHVNLERREKWTGVVLSGSEARLLKSHVANAEADVAARLVVSLLHKKKA